MNSIWDTLKLKNVHVSFPSLIISQNSYTLCFTTGKSILVMVKNNQRRSITKYKVCMQIDLVY